MLALGLADHEVTVEDLAGQTPPVPHFNTPAVAYVLAANLKKGDTVEITRCKRRRARYSPTARR